MNSEDIIEALELTSRLMELHNENPFKVKAMANAAFKLSKLRYDFNGKTAEEIESLEGIGKGISSKIIDLLTKGSTPELTMLLKKTPPGVIEMLNIKGLGPKKVRQLWEDLEIESVGELLYACNENRLITLKGFGDKTQTQVKHSIEFMISNQHKFHYAAIEKTANAFIDHITKKEKGVQVALVGQMARKCEVIDTLEFLIASESKAKIHLPELPLALKPVFHYCEPNEFNYYKLKLSSTEEHLNLIHFKEIHTKHFNSEEEIYKKLNLQYIEPELREGIHEVELARKHKLPQLITMHDLKGILHNHTTYSDGMNSVSEMADYCHSLGYQYLGICDHSRTAVYANGLREDRVYEQQAEIDAYNAKQPAFRILKGIESDILADGALDYPASVLKTFDFVVASVHSGLKMSEDRATERLIKAIENPYTSILGHPTGRLLLSRDGYPVNHKKVIDACAANKVSVELNAHPYRLDIDWRWIPYCMEKGVLISVNPDAHYKEGFHDMYYGICVARKGMLTKEFCLNALSLDELINQFKK